VNQAIAWTTFAGAWRLVAAMLAVAVLSPDDLRQDLARKATATAALYTP